MDFRIIKPKKRLPNSFDKDITFAIPARIIGLGEADKYGNTIPIYFERIDFHTGEMVMSEGITFKGADRLLSKMKYALPFDSQEVIPFNTDAIAYKNNNKIEFKIIGSYNTGLVEKLFGLQDYILDNDEKQIIDLFKSNYVELNDWAGDFESNSNYYTDF